MPLSPVCKFFARNRFALLTFCALTAASSCEINNQPSYGLPGYSPSPVPSFSPTVTEPPAFPIGAPQSSDSSLWNSVTLKILSCDYPGRCFGSNGFTVFSDGSYSLSENSPPSGKLKENEFEGVKSAADSVAAQAPFPTPSCAQEPAMPGASSFSLTMLLNENRESQTILLQDFTAEDLRVCNAGSIDRANQLEMELSMLASQYDLTVEPQCHGCLVSEGHCNFVPSCL